MAPRRLLALLPAAGVALAASALAPALAASAPALAQQQQQQESILGWIASVTVAQAQGLPAMPAWCASTARGVLPPAQDPVLMRWPYVLHAPAQAGADVLFGLYGDTPRPAAAQVEWWTEAAGERGAVAVEADYALRNWVGWPIPFNTTMHGYRARLANLTSGAEICYRVRVDGAEVVGGLRFRTAPARGEAARPVRFVAVGDFGVASMDQGRVADALWARLEDADFSVLLGDDTYFDGKGTWAWRRMGGGRGRGLTYVVALRRVLGHEYHKRTFPYYAAQWASKALVPLSGNHDYQVCVTHTSIFLARCELQKRGVGEGRERARTWARVGRGRARRGSGEGAHGVGLKGYVACSPCSHCILTSFATQPPSRPLALPQPLLFLTPNHQFPPSPTVRRRGRHAVAVPVQLCRRAG